MLTVPITEKNITAVNRLHSRGSSSSVEYYRQAVRSGCSLFMVEKRSRPQPPGRKGIEVLASVQVYVANGFAVIHHVESREFFHTRKILVDSGLTHQMMA